MFSPESDLLEPIRPPAQVAAIRARAIADANRLRGLACATSRDGLPQANLRALNARAAARSILRFAKRISGRSQISARDTGP